MHHLSPKLVERVLTRHPVPIADAVAALSATDSLHERRDRVVEVFRSVIRTMGALTLASRVQFGAGPGGESEDVPALFRALRRHGLTDGRWIGLTRELLRGWRETPGAHPLPELVCLFHDSRSFRKTLEALLRMRKAETIAHGSTGSRMDLIALLERRMPALESLLMAVDPLWSRLRLVVPVQAEAGVSPRARLLMGDTPSRGLWRRIPLDPASSLPPGEALMVDEKGRPALALKSVVMLLRPSPESVEEVFFLDGSHRGKAVYVAFPSMAEHRHAGIWDALGPLLLGRDDGPDSDQIEGVQRPYRGLESFGPEHAAVFFGREQRAEALANRIRRRGFVTVTGPSGSGKSSLIKAGVLPQLVGWTQVIVRPGADPMGALTLRLGEAMGQPPGWAPPPADLPVAVTAWALMSGQGLIVLVDQGEELFTLCHDAEARLSFAQSLAALAQRQGSPGRVVLSVREDFFSRFATLAPFQGLYSREVEVVTTPDREALLRTVILPARRFGYDFEDESMAVAMVDAVEGEPAALTLLQFCADRLWEARDRTWKRLTLGAYEAMGGVAGALASHAEQQLAELTPAQQQLARALLLRLVTADHTRAVVPRSELLEVAEDTADAERVVDRFVDARLLISRESETDGGEAVVELAHEALIGHWDRLQGWLGEDREGRRLIESLRQAARGWDARGRPGGLLWRGEALDDYRTWRRHSAARLTEVEEAFATASEQDDRRRRRRVRVGAAAAFAVLVGVSVVMFALWQLAERTEKAAIRQVSRLLATAAQREVREGDPVLGLLLASEALGVTGAARLDALPVARDAQLEALALVGGYQVRTQGEAISQLSFEGGRLTWRSATEQGWLRVGDPAIIHITPQEGGGVEAPTASVVEAAGEAAPNSTWGPVRGSEDGRVTVALLGQDEVVFQSHEPMAVTAVARSGALVAAAWVDGSLWMWRLPSPGEMASHCDLVGRNLTASEWSQYFPGERWRPTCALGPGVPLVQPSEALLTLVLTGAEGSPPPDKAKLWLDGLAASEPIRAGRVRWQTVAGGRHHVKVQAPGCGVAEAVVTLWRGQREVLTVPLGCEEGAEIAGGEEPRWVPIDGGRFLFSSLEQDPARRKEVNLSPFEILQAPVTAGAYQRCVEAGRCTLPPPEVMAGADCNIAHPDRADHPMTCVNWSQARAFCDYLGGSLPSEAQWEFAANEGGRRAYPWGEEAPTCARAIMDGGFGTGCGQERTWAVCTVEAGRGAAGLCDLSGSVYEWTEDCAHRPGTFEQAPADGSPWVDGCADVDNRVLRGGAYSDQAWKLSPSLNNLSINKRFATDWAGFRCVRAAATADRSRTPTSL